MFCYFCVDRESVLCWLIIPHESLFLNVVFSCASLWKKLFSGACPWDGEWRKCICVYQLPGFWPRFYVNSCLHDSVPCRQYKCSHQTHTQYRFEFIFHGKLPASAQSLDDNKFPHHFPRPRSKGFQPTFYSICPGPLQHPGL